MSRSSILNEIKGFWKRSTATEKLFYAALVVILLFVLHHATKKPDPEGFETSNEFIVKRGSGIYDPFYVDVYDTLLYDSVRNDYEIGRLVEKTTPTKKSVIADIGCGTGHTVGKLTTHNIDIVGIDISPAMISKAKSLYPDANFRQGDALKAMLFPQGSLTHITCLYFTVYMINDKRQFFRNCMNWLMPGGYLVLHLVDREKFSPVVQIGEVLVGVDPQAYAEKRITTTRAEFDNYSYKAKFDIKGDDALFTEVFKAKPSGGVRQNEHNLFMPSQAKVLSMAKDAGFIMISESEMKKCGYHNQFIYVLSKPM